MEQENTQVCQANGCFLPATQRSAGAGWTCIAHAGAAKADFDSITSMMSNRRDLFQVALRLTTANYGQRVDATQAKWLAERGHTGYPAGMSKMKAGAGLLAALVREVRQPQKQMPPPRDFHADAD